MSSFASRAVLTSGKQSYTIFRLPALESRGFNLGEIYSCDGRLVASTAQEGLMRYRPPLEA